MKQGSVGFSHLGTSRSSFGTLRLALLDRVGSHKRSVFLFNFDQGTVVSHIALASTKATKVVKTVIMASILNTGN